MATPVFTRRSLLKAVQARGIRLTAQRKILVEIIQDARDHLDAASLLALARKRNVRIDRATVYRTIELLKKQQLIDELDLMHLNGEKHYYEARPVREHLHLACFGCGEIVELANGAFERLKNDVALQSGFEIQVTRLEMGGYCRRCAAGARSREIQQH
ncbi:MAG: Fur family transcriptional regulator [Acidobacteriota bacterium]